MVLRPRAGRGAGSRDQSPGHRPKGRRRRRLGSRAGEHSAVHAANVDFNPTGVALITSQCRNFLTKGQHGGPNRLGLWSNQAVTAVAAAATPRTAIERLAALNRSRSTPAAPTRSSSAAGGRSPAHSPTAQGELEPQTPPGSCLTFFVASSHCLAWFLVDHLDDSSPVVHASNVDFSPTGVAQTTCIAANNTMDQRPTWP